MSLNMQTGEIVEPLSAMERSGLVHAEAVIERGLTTFTEVGEALSKVRDERLYRDQFPTFEAYCRERWGITDRRARQMIDAASIVEALPTGTVVPVSERQARELQGLEPVRASNVMRQAHEATNGNVTARAIREARSPLTESGRINPCCMTGPGHARNCSTRRPVVGTSEEPPTTRATPRRALTDQFFDAFYELTKAVEKVERLGADDRFPQNAEQVTAKHRSDLSRSIEALGRVLNQFNT